MKIGIFSQWFDPEPGPASLPGALARELSSRGHTVVVVTGVPNYPTGRILPGYKNRLVADSNANGVKIRRVGLIPSHSHSIVGRMMNYVSFAVTATLFGVQALKECDAVWASNSPFTIAMPLLRLRRRFGVPVVLHVLDLWPDNMSSSGLIDDGRLNAWISRFVHFVNQFAYRAADVVATISPGVRKLLDSRGVPAQKIEFSPLWADESRLTPSDDDSYRGRLGTSADKVVILYAGALGGTQSIDTLVKAFGLLNDAELNVECWIAGSGTEEPRLRKLAEDCGLGGSVRFLGRIPMEEISLVMASADVHYVGLTNDSLSEVTMPSKIQSSLAVGKPIVASVGGDVADLVRDSGVGFIAAPADAEAVAEAVSIAARLGRDKLRKIGEKARELYLDKFSLNASGARIEALLETAIYRASAPDSKGSM
ncbi:glycosyltransferase family 4 protein [Paramicrobacterium fandaimingii]|uniref:glycosyltransferase family 4 protein n=1 Tax=Paramicrobacterium fandaimingii TaxID=2708079 RepID=UPI0014212BCF|nr:glycosyltransferase family 4 protein [Microbacterium fandaimingii]